MSRCARPGCNHFQQAHEGRFGACERKPREHCDSYVAPRPPEPEPDVVVEPGGDLRAAVMQASAGERIKLMPGGVSDVTGTIRPKAGMVIDWRGAVLDCSGTDDVFGLKTAPTEGINDVILLCGELFGARRRGIVPWVRTQVIGGVIRGCAERAIGVDSEGVRLDCAIDGVEVHHNGSAGELGPSASGMKFFHTHGVTVRNCNVHDNVGNGVWFDWQSGDALIERNVIERNSRKGVFYEKCGASRQPVYEGFLTVRANRIVGNDTEGVPAAHAGVTIIASRNALVEDNDFGGNPRAIIVRDDEKRRNDDKPGFWVANVTLRNNRLNGSEIVGCDLAAVTCEGNA